MTDMVSELYREIILEHGKEPRNFHKLANPTHTLEGFNPLCGDKITIELEVKDDKIVDVAFQGQGCAISTASASLMTTIMKDKTLTEAQELFEDFHSYMLKNEELKHPKELAALAALGGVKNFPMRIKCATLPWHTMIGALNK